MPMYRFEGDVTIHCVYSPGTWLINRDNLYLTIETFGIIKRTQLQNAIFPLLIHEKFSFDKTFYTALSASNVVDRLEDFTVTIEIRQIADVYLGGTLLAYYTTNAKEFFSPCSKMCLRTLPKRDLLMIKTIDFPGVSPRLEYSVSSAIKCHSSSCYCSCCYSLPQCCCYDPCLYKPMTPTPSYHRATVNSALRSRYPEITGSKYHIASDTANHIAKSQSASRTSRSPRRRDNVDGSYSYRSQCRPRSLSARGYQNYNGISPISSLSTWDLRERTIRDAQDRSDRYWHLYRFWQNEYDRLRLQRC
uniref:Spermatogenesis-associated protein 6 n=1 Tax=Schistosoma japonicum TaxID=6182 RepID=C1LEY0_SCHJA|nr:Spermatogenesis-associated protein 6 precursor [Schistosoma japonicum]